MRFVAVCALAATMMVGGCVYGPPGAYYGPGPGPGYPEAYSAEPGYDAYYDGYYGPITDGYWGPDATFYFMDGEHHWHHDDGGHFGRGPRAGYSEFHGEGGGHGRGGDYGGGGGPPPGREHHDDSGFDGNHGVPQGGQHDFGGERGPFGPGPGRSQGMGSGGGDGREQGFSASPQFSRPTSMGGHSEPSGNHGNDGGNAPWRRPQ